MTNKVTVETKVGYRILEFFLSSEFLKCWTNIRKDVNKADNNSSMRVMDSFVNYEDFVWEIDPDIIIGYNICKFDLPYLIQRAETLGITEFPLLRRIRNSRVRVKDTTFSSRQYGTRESKEVTLEGRVQFDLLQAMQRDYKLSSYSLNSVSTHFLNEQVLSQLLRKAKEKNLVLPNVKQAGSEQGTYEDEAMKLGREAADYISGTFIKPIKLEFEKVYFPYLLISKKRYAGLYWTNPDKFDKMDTKVRRDTAC
ncbi:hypothetical protein L1887_09120 [Cichorium endivia]|nr:hypothetical protein L1887_09120 [Cichorium endivia]